MRTHLCPALSLLWRRSQGGSFLSNLFTGIVSGTFDEIPEVGFIVGGCEGRVYSGAVAQEPTHASTGHNFDPSTQCGSVLSMTL